jgi:hypothetical protein
MVQIYICGVEECARVRKETKAGCRLCFESRSHAGRDVSALLFVYHASARADKVGRSALVCVCCARASFLNKKPVSECREVYSICNLIYSFRLVWPQPIYGSLRPKNEGARGMRGANCKIKSFARPTQIKNPLAFIFSKVLLAQVERAN